MFLLIWSWKLSWKLWKNKDIIYTIFREFKRHSETWELLSTAEKIKVSWPTFWPIFFSSNGGMHLGLLARLVFLIFVLANRGFFSIGAFEGAKTCFSEVRWDCLNLSFTKGNLFLFFQKNKPKSPRLVFCWAREMRDNGQWILFLSISNFAEVLRVDLFLVVWFLPSLLRIFSSFLSGLPPSVSEGFPMRLFRETFWVGWSCNLQLSKNSSDKNGKLGCWWRGHHCCSHCKIEAFVPLRFTMKILSYRTHNRSLHSFSRSPG